MQTPRYAPQIPFPCYAFVPGKHPHPVTDPRGHSFGRPHSIPDPLDLRHPERSLTFLAAIDFFNAGFYWEAHEQWEGLWIAVGRTGELSNFLKGLIKLAAAGVKAREGQIVGVERHARRALELFLNLRAIGYLVYCGMELEQLIDNTRQVVETPIVDVTSSLDGRSVIPFRLTLNVIN